MVAQPMPITTDIYLTDNNTPDKKKVDEHLHKKEDILLYIQQQSDKEPSSTNFMDA
jgi:hypothetical protein